MRILHGWRSDWRQAQRALWHSPRHALTAVLCLMAGIAVNVTVLSLINSLFYGDIPGVRERTSLVRVFLRYDETGPDRTAKNDGPVTADTLSISEWTALSASVPPMLGGLIAEGKTRVSVSRENTTVAAVAAFVSPDYFQVLGTPTFQGRLLARSDDRPDAPPAVVLGYHLWHDELGAPASLPGQTILISGRQFLVAGIAPDRFTGLRPPEPGTSVMLSAQVWIPLQHADRWPVAPTSERAWLEVFGRRQGQVSDDDLRAALAPAAGRLAMEHPDTRSGAAFLTRRHGFSPSESSTDVLIALAMTMAIPLTVLAVACLNVANLQLARATTRAREFAVRLAIGASRLQVVRLMTIEAATLATVATIAGCAASAAGIRLLQSYFPFTLAIDSHVLLATLALTTAVTMVAGVAPAWIATRRLSADHLRRTAQAGGLPHTRLRHSLVVLQIAASFLLLSGSNLFVRTALKTRADIPDAIRQQLIVSFDLGMIGEGSAGASRVAGELESRLTTRRDIAAVSFERDDAAFFTGEGAGSDAEPRFTNTREVTRSYAAATDVRVLSGRWLSATDPAQTVVVNDRFAHMLDPEAGRVVGRVVTLTPYYDRRHPVAAEIVGIVANQKKRIDDENPEPLVFSRIQAMPKAFDMRVRAANTAAVGADLRRIVQEVDPRLPWVEFWQGADLFSGDFDLLRQISLGVGGLGILSLLLAATGLYAVIAYVVSLRQREFGIRLAVGAQPADLRKLVGRAAFRLSAWGLGLGVLIAIPLAFLFRALLLGVSLQLLDPMVWVPVVGLLAVVAFAAALVPARRAARVNPVTVLRAE